MSSVFLCIHAKKPNNGLTLPRLSWSSSSPSSLAYISKRRGSKPTTNDFCWNVSTLFDYKSATFEKIFRQRESNLSRYPFGLVPLVHEAYLLYTDLSSLDIITNTTASSDRSHTQLLHTYNFTLPPLSSSRRPQTLPSSLTYIATGRASKLTQQQFHSILPRCWSKL